MKHAKPLTNPSHRGLKNVYFSLKTDNFDDFIAKNLTIYLQRF